MIVLVLFLIVTKGRQKIFVSVIFISEIFALIVLEYNRPELVMPYYGRNQQFADISITLGFSLLVLAAIIFFIMKNIDIERLKAEESNRLKTYFLANISHEIRTPMNGILGFAELLRDKNLSEKEREQYLNTIRSSGNHLLKLINDVINISRIEAGHAAIHFKTFNLNHLLNDIFDFFKIRLTTEGKPIELKCTMQFDDKTAYISADDIRIRQTFLNLLGNAFKFTNSGIIEFGYSLQDGIDPAGKNLLMFVRDTGIGIDAEDQKMIFDIFKQADDSHTRKYGGTGLGLSITRRLVELMGGEIWVESGLNNGSAFYFTIPYNKAEAVSEKSRKEETEMKPAGRTLGEKDLLLIVEDHDDSFRFLERYLQKQGYSILRAGNGLEAVEYTREYKKIKLILMDIQLPYMSGYEATGKIREFNKTIPIIAQTGNAFEEDRIKCMDAGCTDFITKPLDMKLLMELIRKYTSAEVV
jgi:signal transduction histidine kinase/ActR/RegA family two-component response regulator